MTEQEYINATNRVKVSAALTILSDVLIIDGGPVSGGELYLASRQLREIEEKLFESYRLEEPA